MTDKDKNIYQRILSVMAELNYIQKTDKKVNNQYTFVTHDAVSEAIHPLLVKHGIVMVSTVDTWAQDGNRTSADVTVTFINADKPDESVAVKTFGFGIDPQDKGAGKAISYACKYAVLKTFVLETGDDPERDSIDHVSNNAQELAEKAKIALEKGDWLSLCKLDGMGEDWLSAWKLLDTRKKKAIKELMDTRTKYRDALNDLTSKADSHGTMEVWEELDTDDHKAEVWRCINEEAKEFIKTIKKEGDK
jgi:hypothetical protein